MIEPMQDLKAWVQAYKDDPEPGPIGTEAAITAIDYLLEIFSRHGDLKDGSVMELAAAQKEVHRTIQVLSAFEGRLAIIQYMNAGMRDDNDEM